MSKTYSSPRLNYHQLHSSAHGCRPALWRCSSWSSGRGTLLELNRSSDPATNLESLVLDIWQRNSVEAEQEF
jgi:hypothetical protein